MKSLSSSSALEALALTITGNHFPEKHDRCPLEYRVAAKENMVLPEAIVDCKTIKTVSVDVILSV